MNLTSSSSEAIERIRERMANRKQEIQDLRDIITDEKEHEHGLTFDQASSIVEMLEGFNNDDEDRIESLTCPCGFPTSMSCSGCLEG